MQRGIAVEYVRLFEDELNKKLAAEKKLKNKNLKVRVVFIPVRRDQLLPGLVAGKGDIAAANLTITPERQKLVDFTAAGLSNVSEVVVSGPASPKVASLDDLSGKEVFVRKSSSYYESLVALNKKFAAEKKPPVTLKEAPETLEDEDLLEMLNAGLIPLIVVDKHMADFWKQIFPQLTVHDNVAVRTGGEIALGDPQRQPAAQGGAGRFRNAQQGRDLDRQPAPDALPEERQIREECGFRGGAQEVPGPGPVFPEVRRPVRRGLAADGRAGLPGVAAQPECKKPGGRDRGHAGDARHRQGHEGGRHHARPRRTSTPASSTCA